MLKFLKLQKSIFFLFLLVGGLISVLFKFDLLWDFINYHYYNPWAFFNGRIGYDFWPSGIHSFFNPLIDLPLYLLIKYFNEYPLFIHFVNGLWFGGLSFVFWKVSKLFFYRDDYKTRLSLIFVFLLGATGIATFSQIGSSTNEIQMALLVMSSFYLLLKEIAYNKSGRSLIFLFAGLLLGSAAGLKSTAAIYCLSSGIMLIVFYKDIVKFPRNICIFIIGGLIGFLIFNGFWMWHLWSEYQNPFFPFLNAIFKSDYIPSINIYEKSYFPKTVLEWIFWPYYWNIDPSKLDPSAFIFDIRFSLLYTIVILFLLNNLRLLIFRKPVVKLALADRLLVGFILISFLIWEGAFSVYRYYVVPEMLTSIVFLKCFWYAMPKNFYCKAVYWGIVNIIFFILLSVFYFSISIENRRQVQIPSILYDFDSKDNTSMGYDKFVDMEEINLPDEAVLLMYGFPNAAILPLLNENKNIRGVRMDLNLPFLNLQNFPKFEQEQQKLLQDDRLPKLAIVSASQNNFLLTKFNEDPYIRKMYCRYIKNNIYPMWVFCVPKELKDEIFVK